MVSRRSEDSVSVYALLGARSRRLLRKTKVLLAKIYKLPTLALVRELLLLLRAMKSGVSDDWTKWIIPASVQFSCRMGQCLRECPIMI
ncbi:hypothetical protein Nepgr_008417 [Nepenthes gracilis]|uniref:Uncharacterized protein n=1 Tax=Nepenthes gracilis TaxID=150966 RepID=A0AAD3S8V8_NEPGR|nr:hypothetical protein Nepgr_008417 [Nepenthes gracilis]